MKASHICRVNVCLLPDSAATEYTCVLPTYVPILLNLHTKSHTDDDFEVYYFCSKVIDVKLFSTKCFKAVAVATLLHSIICNA